MHAKNDALVLKLWFDETKHDNFPAFRLSELRLGGIQRGLEIDLWKTGLIFCIIIKIIKIDENEIKDYKWVKITELDKFIENNKFGSPF